VLARDVVVAGRVERSVALGRFDPPHPLIRTQSSKTLTALGLKKAAKRSI
jgi:hypothetical protein